MIKSGPNLPLRDTAGALRARLFVAETQEQQPSAWLGDMGKPDDVPDAVLVGENVKQTAVNYGGESLIPILKRHRVFHLEFHGQATLGGFAASHADGFIDEIDAGDLVSAGRQEERVLAAESVRP
jgi:hypothetical protein